MKKIILLILFLVTLASCKKKEFSPEGPTDIRVKNISDQTFMNVVVNTTNVEGEDQNMGTISSGSYSDYYRFSKAYNKAEITVTIHNTTTDSDEVFTTGPFSYAYLAYLSTVKATYVVWINDYAGKKIEIKDVILESSLKK